MRLLRTKIIFFAIYFLIIFFFSNDFGLIDIEKTAIITALAIDREDNGDYLISAQVAVPEATDTNSENQRAEITGKGSTIGGAIKSISDYTGWFPQLTFCNLIIISSDFENDNLIRIIDYFSDTLRVQDSTLLVYTEGKARDILKESSPLDSISSFAIQKVLLKQSGFNKDVASADIRKFCTSYYSQSASCFMPIVNKLEGRSSSEGGGNNNQGQNQSSGDSNQQSTEKVLFDAKSTALFKNGIYVGKLNDKSTETLNMITEDFSDSTLELKNVNNSNTNELNLLIHVDSNDYDISVKATNSEFIVNICLTINCKIVDDNSNSLNYSLAKKSPLPEVVKNTLRNQLTEQITSLFQTIKSTSCDFLQIKEKLYRTNYKRYNQYKDNYLDLMTLNVKVNVDGQK